MQASGQTEMALRLALKVWDESADDPEAAMLASEVLSAGVPDWHFKVVRDEVRNAAYDAALRRSVRPGMRVLDIGSGTGLLAMMAARAGATRVFSCEMNPAVADAAREIVAANGFADRVEIVAKHSDQLDANADLGGRVDLIVSEIVSNNMLTEGVLATMEYAVGHLLKPGGQVIPARGGVRIALAFDPNFHNKRMASVAGFDLSGFNRLAQPSYNIRTTDTRLQLMSDAAELFEFDFGAAEAERDAHTQRTLTAHGGPVNCVAQWIHLEMDEAGSYENRPGDPKYSNWDALGYPLPKRIEPRAGDGVTVHGSHDLNRVRIWMA